MAEEPKMKEILSDFAFIVGLVLAFIKLFEFLLTVHQKDWLSDRALIFWNWLAGQRRGRFIPILWTAKFQFLVLGLWLILQIYVLGFILGDAIGLLEFEPEPDDKELLSFLALAVGIPFNVLGAILLFQRPFVQELRHASSVRSYFQLLFSYWVFLILIWMATTSFIVPLLFLTLFLMISEEHMILASLLIMSIIAIISPVNGAANLLTQNLVISLAWLFISASIAACLFVVEFILRKILEQSGGLIAGIAALLGIIAGFLKIVL
jgi:hypothetical protein